MNTIYTLWKMKDESNYPFMEFKNSMLGTIFEKDYEFSSLEIGGCGLDGVYAITRKGRKLPIIIFKTKSTRLKSN